jgi:hypothetical protein
MEVRMTATISPRLAGKRRWIHDARVPACAERWAPSKEIFQVQLFQAAKRAALPSVPHPCAFCADVGFDTEDDMSSRKAFIALIKEHFHGK